MKKAKKKTRSKGKKSNVPKILLGLAVLGGATYLGYQYWWLPRQAAKEPKPEDRVDTPTSEQVINTAIQNVDQVPANIAPAKLSPIGTPYSQINYNARIFYGDKGAEVKYIQDILNKTSKLLNLTAATRGYTMPVVTADGIFGKKTYALLKAYFDESILKNGVTPKIATAKYQQQAGTVPIDATAQSFGSGVFSSVFSGLTN